MRIFTEKKLEFRHPVTGETFATRLKDFTNAPEWIEKDPLFAWAVKEGSLIAVEPVPEVAVHAAPAEPKKSTGKRKAESKKEADAE